MSKSPRGQTDSSTTEAGSGSAPEHQARPGFRVKIPEHILSSSTATGGSASASGDAATSKPPPAAAPSEPSAATSASATAASATAASATASKPPPPTSSRSRQSRAEQLLRDLDADIERDKQNRGRRSYSADRATENGSAAKAADDLTVQQHQQALAAASQTVARHQRLQTPPPMHYYSSGGQKSKSADEAATSSKYRDSATPVIADQSAASAAPVSASTGEQQRQPVVRIVESEQLVRETAGTAASQSQHCQNQPRLSSEESQHLLDRLLFEKETMATELNRLRQRQQQSGRLEDEVSQQQRQFSTGRFQQQQQQQQQYPTLPEYDPESAAALKRRIVDLEQQICDLQEANETLKMASSPVGNGGARAPTAAEGRMRAKLDEITVENEALKNELIRLRQQREQPDMAFIRAELDGLRSELDVLRDRNYQLERENRRLLETGSPFLADAYGLAAPEQQLDQQQQQNDIGPIRYYGSLGRAEKRAQPHHHHHQQQHFQQQQQSRVGGQMRHSLDSDFARTTPAQQSRRATANLREAESAIVYDQQLRNSSSWRNGRSASYTSNGGTSDSEDSNTATADLLLYADEYRGQQLRASDGVQQSRGPIGRDRWGAPSPMVPAAGGYFDSNAGPGKQRPNSATQQRRGSRSRQRDISGQSAEPAAGPAVQQRQPFSTAGRLPFAPKQAADIRSGDLVKFTRCGGRISKGLVHFVGRLPGRSDFYVGMELDQEEGKHDGVYDGRRYFQCKPRKGVFVAFNKLIMCYQMAA